MLIRSGSAAKAAAQAAPRPRAARLEQPETQPASRPETSTVAESPEGRSAEEWADLIKQRSTLVGLAEPLGISMGLMSAPLENLGIVGDGLSSAARGDFGGFNQNLNEITTRALNPDGIAGGVYNSALGLRAVSGLAVGGIEVYAGIRSKNPYLTVMGGADLLGAFGTAALIGNANGLALGLSMAATVSKTGLVLAKPKEYSRTQKVKTLMDASGALATTMMKGGILVTPALAVAAVAGLGQIAYMNHSGTRNLVDGIIDRALSCGSRTPAEPTPSPGEPN